MATAPKKTSQRQGFKTGEFIVYPAHGVGQITVIEEQEVAGITLELFVIEFQKDKMRLKVPVAKALTIGMRKLSESDFVDRALKVTQGRARVKRRQLFQSFGPNFILSQQLNGFSHVSIVSIIL